MRINTLVQVEKMCVLNGIVSLLQRLCMQFTQSKRGDAEQHHPLVLRNILSGTYLLSSFTLAMISSSPPSSYPMWFQAILPLLSIMIVKGTDWKLSERLRSELASM